MDDDHEEDYWNPEELAKDAPARRAEQPVTGAAAQPAQDPVEEPVEDPVEEQGEEPAEPPAEDAAREPAEQPVEPPAEDAAEDPVEDAVQEPEERPVEQPVEQSAEEPAEPPAEEAVEEPDEEAAQDAVEQPVDAVETREPADTVDDADQTVGPEARDELQPPEGSHGSDEADAANEADQADQDAPAPAPSEPVGEVPEAAATAVGASAVSAGADHRVLAASSTGTDFDEFAAAAGERDAGDRQPVEGKAAWTRLLKMSKPRATRGNLLVALLAVLLGAGIAAQVQLTNQRGLDELSQTDLVRVLDDVSVRASRLDSQVRELEATRDRLKSGTGTTAEALAQAQKRVDTLGILAGTIPAKGPGITLRISDPDNQVTGPIVLDIIQELRDAGAESIDVGGVRVVASSFVGDRDGEIVVDGKTVSRPLVISVIGDSKTLSSAMTIPGGIVESVRQKGANASIAESNLVEITSIHTPVALKNAKPVE